MARSRKRVEGDSPETKAAKSELSEAFAGFRKVYGDSTIRTGREIAAPVRISTGAFILDFALLGGIPSSRVSMVVGHRHSGKSMISYKIMGNAQKQFADQSVVLLDIEGTHDSTWSEKLGVDIDLLHVAECETGEMAVDIADAVLGSAETSLVVVDSLAALTPMKEIDDSAEDAHVGLQARLISRMVRKVTSSLIRERKRRHFPTLFFVNQFRSKIGGFQKFGEPLSIPGGKALEFSTSVQFEMKNKENAGKDEYGIESMERNEHVFKIMKNKVNQGPRTGEFVLQRVDDPDSFLRAGDIDDSATMLAYAKKFGFYTGGGKRWTLEIYEDSYTFGNQNEAVVALRQDPSLYYGLRDFLIKVQAHNQGMPESFIETIRSYHES
jgi:recombination protein RecA